MLPDVVPVHAIVVPPSDPVSEMEPSLPVVPAKPSNGAPIVNEHPLCETLATMPTKDAVQCSVIVQSPSTFAHAPPPPASPSRQALQWYLSRFSPAVS